MPAQVKPLRNFTNKHVVAAVAVVLVVVAVPVAVILSQDDNVSIYTHIIHVVVTTLVHVADDVVLDDDVDDDVKKHGLRAHKNNNNMTSHG